MNQTHEVLSALLDNQPVDPRELTRALDDPDGRQLLIDFVALRTLVQPHDTAPPIGAVRRAVPRPWRIAAAAAALFLALATGYVAGDRREATTSPSIDAPPPARVVQAVPFSPAGGLQ
jgi:hypothetical protein